MLLLNKRKESEFLIKDFVFKKYKFTKSINKKVLFITNFCELGVETLACMYSIPEITSSLKDYYVIIIGWTGRSYFYRHLCDEFWELDKQFYWLKDNAQAFFHNSKNLDKLEKYLAEHGIVFKTAWLGNFLIGWVCKNCFNISSSNIDFCNKCYSNNISQPLLGKIENKKFLRRMPAPSQEDINQIRPNIPLNSVAIFARNRKTYGRNLSKDFYISLNKLLKEKGFFPVYLGENCSSLNMEGCIDFSNSPKVNDLSFTLSVLSCVRFSVQLWTASTRLSSIVKTPFILVESYEQIAGRGQEGLRIASCNDFNKKKIILSNYINFLNDTEKGLFCISKSIDQIYKNNWNYIYDMVEDKNFVFSMLKQKGLLYW